MSNDPLPPFDREKAIAERNAKFGMLLTEEEWIQQPPELRALGRVAGERAWFEWAEETLDEVRREVDAANANRTPEEIAIREREAYEELMDAIDAESGEL